MTIDLLRQLCKFQDVSNRETRDAYFLTHIPSVGSAAYLNIVYKPPEVDLMEHVGRELKLPSKLQDFYRSWNGARLFVGAFSVYGCLPFNQMQDRSDPTRLLPFDIRDVNGEFVQVTQAKDILCIGSYSHDRSIFCIHRETLSVTCYVGKNFEKIRHEWAGLDHWLTDEIARLSLLFDEKGTHLVDKQFLLPGLMPLRLA